MAENKKINNGSVSRPVGIETSIIEWINDGFEGEADKPENDLSDIEK